MEGIASFNWLILSPVGNMPMKLKLCQMHGFVDK